MLALIIETSTEKGALGLSRDGFILHEISLPPGLQNSKVLIPMIKEMLFQQKITLSDLTHLVVGIGPGSYTGIRVGVIVAKTLSYALKIPLVGVCTLKTFIPQQNGPFAAIIDAKIGGAYFLKGTHEGVRISWEGDPLGAPLKEVIESIKGIPRLVAPMIEPLRSKLHSVSQGWIWEWQEAYPSMKQMALEAMQKIAKGEISTDGHLDLMYLRKTQAELEKQ